MVARSISSQELSSYSHLIQAGPEDELHFIHLEELKAPNHPTHLSPNPSSSHPLYYDLQPLSESCCSTSMFLGSGQLPSSSGMAMEIPQVDSTREHPPKKRKASSYHDGSDDDTIDDKSVRTDDHKKQNHSEIEKRRRDKMNTYITELSAMVPMCHAMPRKLDKLTVLRMAVQHMKTIRGTVQSYTEGNYKPSFLSDLQLKQLINQAAEGFLFVVGCDRGRILYVSESVTNALNFSPSDLLGQSWFDILHPKDVAKVKEQLSSSDLSPRERFIDAKTMLPVKTDLPPTGTRLCPGARRSFFCRMKCKSAATSIKEEADTTTGGHRRKKQQNSDRKYRVIQCTGYMKPWATAKGGLDDQERETEEGEGCNLSCLVAMGRVLTIPISQSQMKSRHQASPSVRPILYTSRHAVDGKFLFVDQRATLALGFLPQELLGTSMYEYFYKDDICHLAEAHRSALHSQEPVTTQVYRFRSKDGNYVQIRSEWKSFKNPWTKEVEYLVAKNSCVISDSEATVESSMVRCEGAPQTQANFEYFSNSQPNGRDITKVISSHMEASNIGRQIADEVLDEQKRYVDSPSTNSTPSPSNQHTLSELQNIRGLSHDRLLSTTAPRTPCKVDDSFQTIRSNVSLSSVGVSEGVEGDEMMEMMSGTVSPQQTVPSDGNDEAAMAVIMSLLEADAGLGGPVDFTGIPWPLP